MILPARGEPVDSDRRNELRKFLTPENVEQRIVRLKAADKMRLQHVFSDEDIKRACSELNIAFRDRCFTPAVVLGLFVSQLLSRDVACSTVLTQFNRERKRQGLLPVSQDASAYCKARGRLSLALINHLIRQSVEIGRSKALQQWKWKGHEVFLVDGLVLRAPDTADNQEAYPQPSSQKDGLGFPQVRMIVTTVLATGCIIHHNTGKVEGKKTGEVTLFREKHADFAAGDIVVADSNFESFHDSALLKQRGVNIVCCINGTRESPFQGICESFEEEIVALKKPRFDKNRFTRTQWESLPDSIKYRIIRYRVGGRNQEITIVTTLLDSNRYPAEDIAQLFGLRWDIELDICAYKSTMDMGELRCHTPENLDREIAVGVLAYNLVRLLMCDTAAVLENIHPRELSFSYARDAWISFSDELKTSNDLMWIILSACGRFVRDRPNREEPRAIKQRHLTKYPKLKEPRPSRTRHPPEISGPRPAEKSGIP